MKKENIKNTIIGIFAAILMIVGWSIDNVSFVIIGLGLIIFILSEDIEILKNNNKDVLDEINEINSKVDALWDNIKKINKKHEK